jgi:murein DD-endopeptidase MepM/ murein hydrolase activator NlpD
MLKFILFLVFLPYKASAVQLNLKYPGFGGESFEYLISLGLSGFIAWLYYAIIVLSSIVAFGVIVGSGVEYLTSAGNPSRMKSAIDRLQNSIIGLLLVLISGLVVGTISPSLLFLDDPTSPLLGMGGGDPVEFPDWPEYPIPEDYFDPPPFTVSPGDPDPENGGPPPILGEGTPYGCPTQGGVSSGYGYRCRTWAPGCSLSVCQNRQEPCWRMHPGIDLAKNNCFTNNYPVYATGSGRVIFKGLSGDYGYRIDIRHENGYLTRYAHLKSFSVENNQDISAGTIIGMMGGGKDNNGNLMPGAGSSTGCHLHYEVRINNSHQNPASYMDLPCS